MGITDYQIIVDNIWLLLCAGLIMLQQGGFLCVEAGVTRKKNSINVALKNIVDLGLGLVIFFLVSHPLILFFESNLASAYDQTANPTYYSLLIQQALFCCTCITIVSGAIAERSTFVSYISITCLVTGLLYPVIAWATWSSNGWLKQLGFLDFAGATVVHSAGGWVSLAAIMVIGPRTNIFDENNKVKDPPATSYPLAILGVSLLWIGWIGFNGVSFAAYNNQVPYVVFITLLGGGIGLSALLIQTKFSEQKISPKVLIVGPLAGLVSVTACAPWITIPQAVLIASCGAIAASHSINWLMRYSLDDVVNAIPVHLVAGLISTLAIGIFGEHASFKQLAIQCLGVTTIGAFCFFTSYAFLSVLKRWLPLRLSAAEEQQGLNIVEHNERTDLIDLLDTMDKHQVSGTYKDRAQVEFFTEVGQIAQHYNRLIDSVEDRENALLNSKTYLETIHQELASAHQQLEEKNKVIDQARQTAEHNSKNKSIFMSHISHELRTPLNAIIGFSNLLKKTQLDESKKPMIEEIARSGSHLLKLTDQITELTMLESGGLYLDTAPIDFNKIITDITEIYEPHATHKGIDFNVFTQIDQVHALGDDKHIKQVFMTLLNNAYEFTEKGEVSFEFTTQLKDDYCACTLKVSDTGIGVTDDKQSIIFEPFRQANNAYDREHEGLGTGLPICKGILKLMDGGISLHTKPNQGSTFTAIWKLPIHIDQAISKRKKSAG